MQYDHLCKPATNTKSRAAPRGRMIATGRHTAPLCILWEACVSPAEQKPQVRLTRHFQCMSRPQRQPGLFLVVRRQKRALNTQSRSLVAACSGPHRQSGWQADRAHPLPLASQPNLPCMRCARIRSEAAEAVTCCASRVLPRASLHGRVYQCHAPCTLWTLDGVVLLQHTTQYLSASVSYAPIASTRNVLL